MRTVYLLRHCETEQDVRARCIGITDIPLSENGLRQALRLKEYFTDKGISEIFCSDLYRAAKTAKIISDGVIPLTKLAGLREINMGDWEGMYFDDIKSQYADAYRRRGLDFAAFSPPNGESFAVCQKRALKVLRHILDTTKGDLILIAHAGINRALLCSLSRIDLRELFSLPQPFGCLNLLSVQNGACRVKKTGFQINQDDFIHENGAER